MAEQKGRTRRLYEPDAASLQLRLEQSGKSIADFAADCDCGESTFRKMLAGKPVEGYILIDLAETWNVPDWHDLLSDKARLALGLPAKIDASAGTIDQPPSPRPVSLSATHTGQPYNLQLPSPLTDFTGRAEQIQELASRLLSSGGKVGLSALRGMGGVGKTSLAVRVAHEVKGRYPDGQLFLSLRGTADGVKESPMTPTEAMTCIIHAFHPEETGLPEKEEELAGVYRSRLAGKRVLIVLDNARSEAQVRILLTAPPSIAFLITSRNAQALDAVAAFQVKELSLHEAYSLLRSILPSKASEAELNTIAEQCCCLPLALRVAGDFLRIKDDWSAAQYIVALKSETTRLRWLRVGDDPAKDVEAVLKLSSAQLVRDSVDRGTRWHLLHIFPGDFDLSAAAAAWGADENDLAVLNDLSDMTNRSLIIYDQLTRRYRLHDLMRPIAEGLFG